MTVSLRAIKVKAVVLDVEGTTTPVAFVYDVLFPYARINLRAFLDSNAGSAPLKGIEERMREEHSADREAGNTPPAWDDAQSSATHEDIAAYADWLMDRDRKSPALKALQGLIWERGFNEGELRGEVFPDVSVALARWHAAGVRVAVYSSGSVLAQRLIFGHSNEGDLTRFLSAFFDTSVGPKREARSYERIAAALNEPPSSLLFISDVPDELLAARQAGYQAALCVRPGNAFAQTIDFIPTISSFDEIVA